MERLKEILGSSKFQMRLLSGIIMVALAVLVITRGGILLFATMILISMCGLFELYRVVKVEREPLGIIGYIGGLIYYGLMWNNEGRYSMPVMIGVVMALLAVFVFTYPRYRTEQVSVSLFGIFYVVVMLSYIYRVRVMHDGFWLVWLVVISSWGCDTCAYVVGMLFGKRHFAPVLSPKKTVAGAIGGAIGAGLLGMIYASFFGVHMEEIANPQAACFFACAAAGAISQIGDLAASAIKRDHDVKDYGNLIPGHGGILDRFDSMLFTAPAIYFVICIFATF